MFGKFLSSLADLFRAPSPPVAPVVTAAELAIDRFGRVVLDDSGLIDRVRFLAAFPVRLVIVRANPVRYGRMDDDWFLISDGAVIWSGKGNADPGRVGLNKLLGLDYARLTEGLWMLAPGRHKLKPRQFIEPRESQAAALGLPEVFTPDDVHKRYLGYVTIERMKDATTVSKRSTGRYGINCHESGSDREDKTGSAGCLTLPNKRYSVFRDAAYRAMGTETDKPRQRVLPVTVVLGPLG